MTEVVQLRPRLEMKRQPQDTLPRLAKIAAVLAQFVKCKHFEGATGWLLLDSGMFLEDCARPPGQLEDRICWLWFSPSSWEILALVSPVDLLALISNTVASC